MRPFHDSTTDFSPQDPESWDFHVGAPRTGEVVCHNDGGPYNAIYSGGRPVAFIDWDSAAPVSREWDVAYALWRFVPLYPDAQCARLKWPIKPRGPRIRRFLDAYGLEDDLDMLQIVEARQQSVRATLERRAADGDPAHVRLVAEGRLIEISANLNYLRQSSEEWKPFLR